MYFCNGLTIDYSKRMHTGIIKIVDFAKGLGYVRESTGREIVLIAKGLENIIAEGIRVSYNVKQTRRGIIAVDVHPING